MNAVVAAPRGAEAPSREGASALGVVEELAREPARLIAGLAGREAAARVRTMLATIVVAGGTFGAVVGAGRGGVQIAYAAIKVPALLIATFVVCVPAFVGIARGLGLDTTANEVIGVTLAACGRAALVLAGLAPVVWLLAGWSSYHGATLVVAAAAGAAGLAGATLLVSSFARRGRMGAVAGLSMLAVYAVVGSQSAWLLRPFLVRPKTTHVPFLRPLEGDLFGSLRTSAQSATGHYDDDGAWLGSRGGQKRTPPRRPSPPAAAQPVPSPESR